MLRIEEYHFDGLDPLQWTKMLGLSVVWILLFVSARHLSIIEGVVMVSCVSFFTAVVWRGIVSSTRSGCWMTTNHFHVYYGEKHWSFPLSGIASISGRNGPFAIGSPYLELTGGRRVRLPITALPLTKQLRRWFAHSAIRVDALQTPA
ncbi:hypothetical protein [Thalassovita sp.]|uniref:hypothetical protein n=1 Tax=Thalassovita sp. TaxID=1979401 RepID=UPI002B274E8B|nr:hypothetical protein [Thalassovita sp.]